MTESPFTSSVNVYSTQQPPLGGGEVDDVPLHNRNLQPHLLHVLHASHRLQLSVETTFTGAVLLHRLSIASVDISAWSVVSCLLLACKREEEPRRLRDFINCLQMNISAANSKNQWMDLDDTYWETKEQLVRQEQTALRWLSFDVAVSRPHRAVVVFLQDSVADSSSAQTVARLAFERINNSVFAVQALQFPADVLAIAAIRLVLLDDENRLPTNERERLLGMNVWNDLYGIQLVLDSIEAVQETLQQAKTTVEALAFSNTSTG